jgi:non-lysosomal glucosylceramidase
MTRTGLPEPPSNVRTFPREARIAAFLLGGIGTGNVSVGSRGELRDWELFNHPGKGDYMPFSFFALRAAADDHVVSRVLEAQLNPPHAKSHGYFNGELAGLPRFRHSRMWATYPFVYVELWDDDVPVRVVMEAFTPFVPLDEEASGIPGAIIRYHVRNSSDRPQRVSVVGSMANALGFRGYDVFGNLKLAGAVANRVLEGGPLGVSFSNAADPGSEVFGTIAFATTAPAATVRRSWLEGQWTDNAEDFWQDFTADGELDAERVVTAKGSELGNYVDFSYMRLREKVGSVCVAEMLAPGETRRFEFALAWHIPNRPKGWVEVDDDLERHARGEYPTIRNHYAIRFADAEAVLCHLVAELPTLEARTRAFTDALYATTAPAELLEAVSSNITVIRSHTCFWLEDGGFYGWEGIRDHVGCGLGNVNHVWNYAQTLAYLFPRLEQRMRETEFLVEQDPDGCMPFRSRKSLGEPRWQMVPAADGQLGAIIRAYREWVLSGDDAFLTKLWPRVVAAMDYALGRWDEDGDLVPDSQQSNTYDIEFYGPNGMIATLMIGALRAVERMAIAVGDDTVADRYRGAADRSAATFDRLCWNGEFYEQRFEDIDAYRYQFGRGCHSDQLLGQFLAYTASLGPLLAPDRMRSALLAVHSHNLVPRMEAVETVQRVYALNDEPGLLLCSWPHGGRPRFPFGYSDEVWTGVEYAVASNLLYLGLTDAALDIVRAVRSRHDGIRRSPWSESEAGHHYTRSLASWGLLTGLSGFEADLPAGVVRFAPTTDGEFTTFWSHGRGWGIYRQWREQDGLQAEVRVIEGELGAERLETPATQVKVRPRA